MRVTALSPGRVLLMALPLAVSAHLQAATYKCQVDGTLTLQDRPCANAPGTKRSKAAANPTPLHHSWLETPRYLPSKVSCSETGCRCGSQSYEYQNSDIRLLNATGGLEMRWRFYTSILDRYQGMGDSRSQFPAVKRSLHKAACSLAINQETVRRFYAADSEAIFADFSIANRAREANRTACPKPNESGWTDSDAAKSWARCKSRNRGQHNKRVRLSKRKSVRYNSLMTDLETLKKARQATVRSGH